MHSPVGPITVSTEDDAVVAVDWGWGRDQFDDPLLEEAVRQLQDYFDGRRRGFALPLAPRGTAYRRRVWDGLCRIPYGTTTSYGALAAGLGGSARSIGQANRDNPIPILIPCHRVVGADSIGGYSAGSGIELKRFLLDLERMHCSVTEAG